MLIKKRIIKLFLLLLLMTGCSRGGNPAEQSENANRDTGEKKESLLIVGPRSAGSLPALWMQEKGEDFDLPEIKVQLYSSMDAMMAMALSDECDMIMIPTHVASVLHNKGFDIKLLNVFQWGGLFLASTDPQCLSWKDLEGEELYVPSMGSVPDLATQIFLKENGLTIGKNISVVYSNHVEIAQLLANGTISHAVDVQPFVAAHENELNGYHVVSDFAEAWWKSTDGEYRMPGFCLISKSKSLNVNVQWLNHFNDQFGKAVNFLLASPEESGRLAHDFINADAELISDAIGGFGFSCITAEGAQRDVENYFSVLFGMKEACVGGALPDKTLFLGAE